MGFGRNAVSKEKKGIEKTFTNKVKNLLIMEFK